MAMLLGYLGAGVIFAWGVGHLIPTRSVVSGFGGITRDNRLIITMEWVAAGLTLCFIGLLSALITLEVGVTAPGGAIVLRACAGMLLVLATVSVFTGARTSMLPMKLCPVISSIVAVVFVIATLIS